MPAVYQIGEKFREKAQYKSAISAYKFIVDNFPESEQAVWAQRGLASSYIGLGDIESAQIQTQKLIDNYINDPNIAQSVFEVADTYCWFGKNDKARPLYQMVIDNWPAAQHSMWSQMEIAISYIADGNDLAAKDASDKLILNYGDNVKLPEALFYIAGRYAWSKKYDSAYNLFQYIADNFPQTSWAENAVFESHKNNVYQFLDNRDEPNALSAINSLINAYRDKPELPAAVYDFAARHDWINGGKVTELSREIYNRISNDFPDSVQARSSVLGMRKADITNLIESGDDANALTCVKQLVTDFKGNGNLPEIVYRFGEIYWKRAVDAKRKGDENDAKEAFRKAACVWEEMNKLLPVSAPDVVEDTYHGLSICFQQLGDYGKATEYYNKIVRNWPAEIDDFEYESRDFISADNFCGAYTAWYALQYYGLQASINDIISQMGIAEKGYSSIADIVAILDNKGISAKAVKISFENIEKVNMPFIQYLCPVGGGGLGHFVLCIPAGAGKVVVLDGEEEPKLVDLSLYKDDNIIQMRWDGTAVLIEGIKADFKQSLISWRISLLYSRFWLSSESVSEGFVSQNLKNSEMKLLLGGWSDLDCLTVDPNCYTVPTCVTDSNCINSPNHNPCTDTTSNERCLPQGSIGWPCNYDPNKPCSPMRHMTSFCITTIHLCGVQDADAGDCNPLQIVTQCRDWW